MALRLAGLARWAGTDNAAAAQPGRRCGGSSGPGVAARHGVYLPLGLVLVVFPALFPPRAHESACRGRAAGPPRSPRSASHWSHTSARPAPLRIRRLVGPLVGAPVRSSPRAGTCLAAGDPIVAQAYDPALRAGRDLRVSGRAGRGSPRRSSGDWTRSGFRPSVVVPRVVAGRSGPASTSSPTTTGRRRRGRSTWPPVARAAHDQPVGVESVVALPDGSGIAWWSDDTGDENGTWVVTSRRRCRPARCCRRCRTAGRRGCRFDGAGGPWSRSGSPTTLRTACTSRRATSRRGRCTTPRHRPGVGREWDDDTTAGCPPTARCCATGTASGGDVLHLGLRVLDVDSGARWPTWSTSGSRSPSGAVVTRGGTTSGSRSGTSATASSDPASSTRRRPPRLPSRPAGPGRRRRLVAGRLRPAAAPRARRPEHAAPARRRRRRAVTSCTTRRAG